ncbi:MAG: hypothetical protein QXI58_01605 [Candidatus Micrarchaeia archaeon]
MIKEKLKGKEFGIIISVIVIALLIFAYTSIYTIIHEKTTTYTLIQLQNY